MGSQKSPRSVIGDCTDAIAARKINAAKECWESEEREEALEDELPMLDLEDQMKTKHRKREIEQQRRFEDHRCEQEK